MILQKRGPEDNSESNAKKRKRGPEDEEKLDDDDEPKVKRQKLGTHKAESHQKTRRLIPMIVPSVRADAMRDCQSKLKRKEKRMAEYERIGRETQAKEEVERLRKYKRINYLWAIVKNRGIHEPGGDGRTFRILRLQRYRALLKAWYTENNISQCVSVEDIMNELCRFHICINSHKIMDLVMPEHRKNMCTSSCCIYPLSDEKTLREKGKLWLLTSFDTE